MVRQKSRDASDRWQASPGDDGVWVSRELRGGWRMAHRVVLQGATPVIAETRLTAPEPLPFGGISSDVLREVTLGGAREAAEKVLTGPRQRTDLRPLEALSPSAKRRGEAQRWSLALTSWAYVEAVNGGSRHPNEDVADALGVAARTVRDRLYAARTAKPPLLAGGGGKGVVGRPALTDAGRQTLDERMKRIMAAQGIAPSEGRLVSYRGSLAAFAAMNMALLHDAEQRIPGFWDLSPEEIARVVEENPPKKTLVPGPHGSRIVDVDEHGRPQ